MLYVLPPPKFPDFPVDLLLEKEEDVRRSIARRRGRRAVSETIVRAVAYSAVAKMSFAEAAAGALRWTDWGDGVGVIGRWGVEFEDESWLITMLAKRAMLTTRVTIPRPNTQVSPMIWVLRFWRPFWVLCLFLPSIGRMKNGIMKTVFVSWEIPYVRSIEHTQYFGNKVHWPVDWN